MQTDGHDFKHKTKQLQQINQKRASLKGAKRADSNKETSNVSNRTSRNTIKAENFSDFRKFFEAKYPDKRKRVDLIKDQVSFYKEFQKYVEEKYSSDKNAQIIQKFPNLSDLQEFYNNRDKNIQELQQNIKIPKNDNFAISTNYAIDGLIYDLIIVKKIIDKCPQEDKELNKSSKYKINYTEEHQNNYLNYLNFVNKLIKIESKFDKSIYHELGNEALANHLLKLYSKKSHFKQDSSKDQYYSTLENLLINHLPHLRFDEIKTQQYKESLIDKGSLENQRGTNDLTALFSILRADQFDNEKESFTSPNIDTKISGKIALNLNNSYKNDKYLQNLLNEYGTESRRARALIEKNLREDNKYGFPEIELKRDGIKINNSNIERLILFLNKLKNSPSLISIPSVTLGVDISEDQESQDRGILNTDLDSSNMSLKNNSLFAKLARSPSISENSIQLMFEEIPLKFNDEKLKTKNIDTSFTVSEFLKLSMLISSMRNIRSDQKIHSRSVNLQELKNNFAQDSKHSIKEADLINLINKPYSEEAQKLIAKILLFINDNHVRKVGNRFEEQQSMKQHPKLESIIFDLANNRSLPELNPKFIKVLVRTFAENLDQVKFISKLQSQKQRRKIEIFDLNLNEIKKIAELTKGQTNSNKESVIKNILNYSSHIEFENIPDLAEILAVLDEINKQTEISSETKKLLLKKIKTMDAKTLVNSIIYNPSNLSPELLNNLFNEKLTGTEDLLKVLISSLEEFKTQSQEQGLDMSIDEALNQHNLQIVKSFINKEAFKNLKENFLNETLTDEEIDHGLDDLIELKASRGQEAPIILDLEEFRVKYPELEKSSKKAFAEVRPITMVNKLDIYENIKDLIKDIDIHNFLNLQEQTQTETSFRINFQNDDKVSRAWGLAENYQEAIAYLDSNNKLSSFQNSYVVDSNSLLAFKEIIEKVPLGKFSLPKANSSQGKIERQSLLGRFERIQDKTIKQKIINSIQIKSQAAREDLKKYLLGSQDERDLALKNIDLSKAENYSVVFSKDYSEEARLMKLESFINTSVPSQRLSKSTVNKLYQEERMEDLLNEGLISKLRNLNKSKNDPEDFIFQTNSFVNTAPYFRYLKNKFKSLDEDEKKLLERFFIRNTNLLYFARDIGFKGKYLKNIIDQISYINPKAHKKFMQLKDVTATNKISLIRKMIELGYPINEKLTPVKNISMSPDESCKELFKEISKLNEEAKAIVLSKLRLLNDNNLINALSSNHLSESDKNIITENINFIYEKENVGIPFFEDIKLNIKSRVNLLNAIYSNSSLRADLINYLKDNQSQSTNKLIIEEFSKRNGGLLTELKNLNFKESEILDIASNIKKLSSPNYSAILSESLSKEVKQALVSRMLPDDGSNFDANNIAFLIDILQRSVKYECELREINFDQQLMKAFDNSLVGFKALEKFPFTSNELSSKVYEKDIDQIKLNDFLDILKSDRVNNLVKHKLLEELLQKFQNQEQIIKNKSKETSSSSKPYDATHTDLTAEIQSPRIISQNLGTSAQNYEIPSFYSLEDREVNPGEIDRFSEKYGLSGEEKEIVSEYFSNANQTAKEIADAYGDNNGKKIFPSTFRLYSEAIPWVEESDNQNLELYLRTQIERMPGNIEKTDLDSQVS